MSGINTRDMTNAEVKTAYEANSNTNPFTDSDKTKLDGVAAGAEVNTANSVAGKTGDVILAKADVGLGSVDNTSDAGKPVSTAMQTALDLKANQNNVLELDNTTMFTPDADYEPATKKYVDDLIEQIEELQIETGIKIKDIDGNIYETVMIGTQRWMTENLKTTKYNDGTAIPLVIDNTAWINLITPGYCYFNNNQSTYGETYGALYNWYTVETGILCPTGWHVPTDAEWTTLTDYLGGLSVAGDKLREASTTYWQPPYTGTNESGFTALPSDSRNSSDGSFGNGVSFGCWWSSTVSATYPWRRLVIYNFSSVAVDNGAGKACGFSVRCIRN